MNKEISTYFLKNCFLIVLIWIDRNEKLDRCVKKKKKKCVKTIFSEQLSAQARHFHLLFLTKKKIVYSFQIQSKKNSCGNVRLSK